MRIDQEAGKRDRVVQDHQNDEHQDDDHGQPVEEKTRLKIRQLGVQLCDLPVGVAINPQRGFQDSQYVHDSTRGHSVDAVGIDIERPAVRCGHVGLMRRKSVHKGRFRDHGHGVREVTRVEREQIVVGAPEGRIRVDTLENPDNHRLRGRVHVGPERQGAETLADRQTECLGLPHRHHHPGPEYFTGDGQRRRPRQFSLDQPDLVFDARERDEHGTTAHVFPHRQHAGDRLKVKRRAPDGEMPLLDDAAEADVHDCFNATDESVVRLPLPGRRRHLEQHVKRGRRLPVKRVP